VPNADIGNAQIGLLEIFVGEECKQPAWGQDFWVARKIDNIRLQVRASSGNPG